MIVMVTSIILMTQDVKMHSMIQNKTHNVVTTSTTTEMGKLTIQEIQGALVKMMTMRLLGSNVMTELITMAMMFMTTMKGKRADRNVTMEQMTTMMERPTIRMILDVQVLLTILKEMQTDLIVTMEETTIEILTLTIQTIQDATAHAI